MFHWAHCRHSLVLVSADPSLSMTWSRLISEVALKLRLPAIFRLRIHTPPNYIISILFYFFVPHANLRIVVEKKGATNVVHSSIKSPSRIREWREPVTPARRSPINVFNLWSYKSVSLSVALCVFLLVAGSRNEKKMKKQSHIDRLFFSLTNDDND